MPEASSLELRTVLQQFSDSTATLEELRERLRALALAEDVQSRAAGALDGTASSVGRFVDEAGAATRALQGASEAATQSLIAARTFLDGTDLSGLHTAVQSLEQTVRELASGIANQAAEMQTLASGLSNVERKLESELDVARRELVEARAALAELEDKINAIPERSRRKLGL